MKKYILLFTVVSFCSTAVLSQTKRLAIESHSGTSKEFDVNSADDFGLGGAEYRKKTVDSAKTNKNQKSKDSAASKNKPKADSAKKPQTNTK